MKKYKNTLVKKVLQERKASNRKVIKALGLEIFGATPHTDCGCKSRVAVPEVSGTIGYVIGCPVHTDLKHKVLRYVKGALLLQ